MSWLRTRKPIVFSAFLIFSTFAGLFFVEGYFTNPDLPNPYRKSLSWKWESGEEDFALPKIIATDTLTNIVRVFCNVTTYDFTVGTPSLLDVSVIVPKDINYVIDDIEVQPYDATEYFPPFVNISATRANGMFLGLYSNLTFSEAFSAKEAIEFQSLGQVNLNIIVFWSPSPFVWNMINWSTFSSEYATTLQFPSITIESGQTIQQQASENRNLSLAYFVLFFASTDIAIALYDHSEDKDKTAEYQEEKEKKKHGNITQYGKYVV
jgi:hypothetical protein